MDGAESGSGFKGEVMSEANAILKLYGRIENRIGELEKREFMINWLENKITLNIGGQKFTTSRPTLLNAKGTYFEAMLSSGKWQPDGDGEYLIDRNPKYFSIILDYLRTSKLNTMDLNEVDHQMLREDLDYYLMSIPSYLAMKSWSWNKDYCGHGIAIQDHVVSKQSRETGWNAAVLGSVPNLPSFKLRLKKRSGGGALIGMAPKDYFNPNGPNYKTCGWYYFAFNGGIFSAKGESNCSYGAAMREGSTVEVILDRGIRSLSFAVDGELKGVAFRNVGEEELFPAVCIHSHGMVFEIIQ